MDTRSLEELETAFKVLSNINRLKLLYALQEPKGYAEIELTPSRNHDVGSQDRAISRQAVRKHLKQLSEVGLVKPIRSENDADRFIVDRARVFAFMEQMRELARVEPAVDAGGKTMGLQAKARGRMPEDPHLVLARGIEEGKAFTLEDEGPHVIGRSPSADIPLEYDAFVSTQHAQVVARADEVFVRDLPENKNGTFLNWNKIKKGAVAPLEPGDVLGVGRSLLVFRGNVTPPTSP